MKITFCLPGPGNEPVGGYKMVYEYANRLVKRGHSVVIVYDASKFAEKYIGFIPNCGPKFLIKKVLIKIFRSRITWFDLENEIKRVNALSGLSDKELPEADIVIATAIETVEPVYNLSGSKGKKVAFAQDIENWNFSDEYVNMTYGLPFKYIAVSEWIRSRISKYSVYPVELIPNGIDFSKLYVKGKIEKRNPAVVSMLYHSMPNKGCKYGISALLKLKEFVPELKVLMFGVPKRPANLPEWFHYTQKATEEQLLEIYNESAVFLCPTIDEGFGLTGAESMACGCALVSTNYTGVMEYAEDNVNSLLCEKENADSLCAAMKKLIDDNEIRIKLAKNGVESIKKLDWKKAVEKFEEVLVKVHSGEEF